MNAQPLFGIMTVHKPGYPPFPEEAFFKKLLRAAEKEGIQTIVFHPDAIRIREGKVKGYRLNLSGKWEETVTDLPRCIYDRCFYIGKVYNMRYKSFVERLQHDKRIQFLGIGLKGKWQVYKILSQDPVLSEFLPETEIVEGAAQIDNWLKRHSSIVLKPVSGSLGIGVLKVSRDSKKSILVQGRDLKNKSFEALFPSFESFIHFFQPFKKNNRYLIQPYLPLKTPWDVPYDVRVFVQRDGSGQWITTGKAVRLGQGGSITSNLHGGGKACAFLPFLKTMFNDEQIESIQSKLELIEQMVPQFLERHTGPLFELGIDAGIDLKGNVWIIEVNSKPGRQIFAQLKEKETFEKSQLNPLYYAKYILQSQTGGYKS